MNANELDIESEDRYQHDGFYIRDIQMLSGCIEFITDKGDLLRYNTSGKGPTWLLNGRIIRDKLGVALIANLSMSGYIIDEITDSFCYLAKVILDRFAYNFKPSSDKKYGSFDVVYDFKNLVKEWGSIKEELNIATKQTRNPYLDPVDHVINNPPCPYQISTLKLSHLSVNICGIYFLVHDNKVVYVGQSTDIINRIAVHKQGETGKIKKIFDSVFYVECLKEQLTEVEFKWIKKLKPKYNKVGLI